MKSSCRHINYLEDIERLTKTLSFRANEIYWETTIELNYSKYMYCSFESFHLLNKPTGTFWNTLYKTKITACIY